MQAAEQIRHSRLDHQEDTGFASPVLSTQEKGRPPSWSRRVFSFQTSRHLREPAATRPLQAGVKFIGSWEVDQSGPVALDDGQAALDLIVCPFRVVTVHGGEHRKGDALVQEGLVFGLGGHLNASAVWCRGRRSKKSRSSLCTD